MSSVTVGTDTLNVDRQAPADTLLASLAAPVPVRYEFLDGLRGLASLYVLLHHLSQIYLGEQVWPPAAYYWFNPLIQYGHHAVAVFIALSGFCLMLPIVRSADGMLRGGFRGYMSRRLKRILPPYYAAIAFTFLLVLLVPIMRRTNAEFWGYAFGPSGEWQSMFEWKNLVAHLTLFHGLHPDWINRIDPPMWSIAIEWINYLLFPIFFLPLWRKFGNTALVIGVTVLCFLPYLTKPLLHTDQYTFHWMQPWFIALFAIGMAGASIVYPRGGKLTPIDQQIRKLALHPIVLIILTIALAVCMNKRVPAAFIVGALSICLILHCATNTAIGRKVRWAMEAKPMLWLGTISYSLYLFHTPLLQLAHRLIEGFHWSGGVRFAFMTLVATPLTLVTCHFTYRILEHPFLSRRNKASGSVPR